MKKWIKAEEVIKLMKEGWELGHSIDCGRGTNRRYWLQKDGLCKGGDTISIHSKTIDRLQNLKLIEYSPRLKNDSFWLTRYRLK